MVAKLNSRRIHLGNGWSYVETFKPSGEVLKRRHYRMYLEHDKCLATSLHYTDDTKEKYTCLRCGETCPSETVEKCKTILVMRASS